MNESGFTFVELLTDTVFIAVLSGLAVTHYIEYKTEGYNTAANADFRNAMTALEVYDQDNEEYPTCSAVTCPSTLPGFSSSNGVQVTFVGDEENVTGVACHEKGNTRYIFTGMPGLIVSMRTGPCGV